MNTPRRILFLCTGNSCRSQMAEGFLREVGGSRYESLSAGSRPAGFVHPLARRVMAEIGVDLSGQSSKSIHELLPPKGAAPDLVVSVCDAAANDCPAFPGRVGRLHWPFADPAAATGSDDERLLEFRRVRDQIRERIDAALAANELG